MDDRDWSTVTVSLFLEDKMGMPAIGMNELQSLSCSTESDMNSSAHIMLEFMGKIAKVKANATVSDLRYDRAPHGRDAFSQM